MDFVAAFNAAEAAWWILLSLIVAAVPRRYLLAAALFTFGLSDLIELWSGAWWRPWWLAALKVACLLAIAVLGWKWLRETRRIGP